MSLPFLVLIAVWGGLAPVLAKESKPNILVIFGDDVGWMNVSSFGSDFMGVKTPNIDRIGHKEFPVRRVDLSAQMGKTIESIQSQILKIQHAD